LVQYSSLAGGTCEVYISPYTHPRGGRTVTGRRRVGEIV
jgi:hypothetical protein